MKTCTSCHTKLHHSARHPVCFTCRSSRTCEDCDTPVSYNSTGRCRTCTNRARREDAAYVARQAEAMRAFNTDPAHAEARRVKAQKAAKTKRQNPETMEKLREAGRRYGAANISASHTPEVRARAGRTISRVKQAQRAARLAWCPPERLPEYERLSIMFGVKEAKRMILADMTPFERQMARLAAGATLVEKPVIRRGDHDMTLGGVATGMI